jgi:hypothetical protein
MSASLGTLRNPQSLAVTLFAHCVFAHASLAEPSPGFDSPASPPDQLLKVDLTTGADGDARLAVAILDDSLKPLATPLPGDYALRILNAAGGGTQKLRVDPIDGAGNGNETPSATFVSIPVSADPAAQRVEISFDGELKGSVVADPHVVWISSIDGVLGTGPSLTVDPSALSEGTHVMRLEGRDSAGLSSAATTRIQTRRVVTSQQPVAMAGDDRVVGVNSLVTLDGTGSFDPDEERIEYDWRQIAGPSVTLSDSSNVQPTFRAPSVSVDTTLTFELFVFDDTLLSQPDQVNITVSSGVASNTPPPVRASSTPTGQASQDGGGGGTFGLVVLLLLTLGVVRRRLA